MWAGIDDPVGLGWHAAPLLSIDHTSYGPPRTIQMAAFAQNTTGEFLLWYTTILSCEIQVWRGSDLLTIFGTLFANFQRNVFDQLLRLITPFLLQ